MSGGAAIAESLKVEGVRHVFGLIGTATMEILDSLYGSDSIRYVGVRHEQNAGHMADAYARVTRRAGVALAGQAGPGATNLVTGVAQAFMAFSPMVAITGLPISSQIDTGTFQELDQQAFFGPITKKTFTVRDPARIPEYLRDAFRIAESGRQGPVVLGIPGDVLGAHADIEIQSPETYRAIDSVAPSPAAIDRIVQLLSTAKRPVIVAGAGVKWARADRELAALAELIGVPVVASAGNPDVLPNDHELYAGQVGPRGNEVATGLTRSADVILAIGTRLGFNSTFYSSDNISAAAAIIQVDVEPSAIGRHFPVRVGVVADAGETLRALLRAGESIKPTVDPGWVGDFKVARGHLLEARAQVGEQNGMLVPVGVCNAVQRVLPRDTIITLDTGTCCMQSTDVLRTFSPGSFLAPLDFGLVGFAHAAGIGAKAAAPDRPVVTIMGDGGFGMAMGEIGSAMAAGLPTVTVVMNNGSWGAEKAYQRDFYGGRFIGAENANPAFDAIARAFGAHGVVARTAEEVSAAVAEGLESDVPTVVEVPVDPAALVSLRRDAFAHRVQS